MDTINETINALLDEAAEYRQHAEEKPAFANDMLYVASQLEDSANELMAKYLTGKPGA